MEFWLEEFWEGKCRLRDETDKSGVWGPEVYVGYYGEHVCRQGCYHRNAR